MAIALAVLWLEQMAVGWIATKSHGRFGDELHTAGSIFLMAMGIAAGPMMLLRGVVMGPRAPESDKGRRGDRAW